MLGGWYERHWTAEAARIIAEFWLAHWKFIVTTGIALGGLLMAYSKL